MKDRTDKSMVIVNPHYRGFGSIQSCRALKICQACSSQKTKLVRFLIVTKRTKANE